MRISDWSSDVCSSDLSKSESIQVGDGPRAHGEDVTQYAADTSGCALVRFYVGRVVVTLHLEDGGLPIADIYHARILAGTANYLRARGGQFLQVNARAFIAAMLRPHDRENAKLRQVGLATQRLQYAGIFFFIETMVGNDLRSDEICALGHAHALSRGGQIGRASRSERVCQYV